MMVDDLKMVLKMVFLRSENVFMIACTSESPAITELRTVLIPWRRYEQESSLSARLNRVVTVWRSLCQGDAKSGWPED